MIIKNGIIECCNCENRYNWKTFFIEMHEVVAYGLDDVQENVTNKSIVNGLYFITTCCPKCGNREYVTISK